LALGLVVLPLLQHGLKELVDRPRPTPDLVELRAGFSSPSFPSGHVMSGALLYGFLLYLSLWIALPRMLKVALVGWCALVLVVSGPANVYVGVHWPSDVVGGYAWAAVLLLPLVYADQAMGRRRW
jgi:membrane-associated phospholipid phosphatase